MNAEEKIAKEDILNVANFLTLLRVISAFVVFYFIFADFNIIYVLAVFCIGMLTDFFDGQVARIFNQKTEFGRRFDIVADRVLIIGTIIALASKLSINGNLLQEHFFQIFFMMSREIIALPFAVLSVIFRTEIPHVRYIGKITTFLESIAIPLVFLSVFYPFFSFSWTFAVITGLFGIVAGFYYAYDMLQLIKAKINK